MELSKQIGIYLFIFIFFFFVRLLKGMSKPFPNSENIYIY